MAAAIGPTVDGVCLDSNPCTLDVCDVGKGCVGLAVQATCSDGNACTAGAACGQGKCAGSKAVVCDDGNVCTDDSCGLALGCTATANAAKCDDGDLCTVADGCQGGKCQGGGALDCSDGNACTVDACGKASGCAWKVAVCDDGNGCTKDSCDKGKGCVNAVQAGGACDDGNQCTQGDSCDAAGTCVAGKVVVDCGVGPCVKGKEEWGVGYVETVLGGPSTVYRALVAVAGVKPDMAAAVGWHSGNTNSLKYNGGKLWVVLHL